VVQSLRATSVAWKCEAVRRTNDERLPSRAALGSCQPGGGAYEVLRELRDERRFPGMKPVGRYPIHIVVKHGRTMLLGIVDNAADRQIAEVRAREVTGVFDVENGLSVAQPGKGGAPK